MDSVDRLAHKLHLSSFAVSFFLLGILTSVPEISVGVNSLIERKPEIFVGNLIGGIIVIFLLIIPVLAVFGNGVKLTHQMSRDHLVFGSACGLSLCCFAIYRGETEGTLGAD